MINIRWFQQQSILFVGFHKYMTDEWCGERGIVSIFTSVIRTSFANITISYPAGLSLPQFALFLRLYGSLASPLKQAYTRTRLRREGKISWKNSHRRLSLDLSFYSVQFLNIVSVQQTQTRAVLNKTKICRYLLFL